MKERGSTPVRETRADTFVDGVRLSYAVSVEEATCEGFHRETQQRLLTTFTGRVLLGLPIRGGSSGPTPAA